MYGVSLGPEVILCCKVQEHIRILVTAHFNNDVEAVMRDPILFGDFRTALHEEEARIYEDIQDYEAAKALFQVRMGLTSPRITLLGCPGGGAGENAVPVCNLGMWACVWLSGVHVLWCMWMTWWIYSFRPLGPILMHFPSSNPWRVPGFWCTPNFGNPSSDSLMFIFILIHKARVVVIFGLLLANHRPADWNLFKIYFI